MTRLVSTFVFIAAVFGLVGCAGNALTLNENYDMSRIKRVAVLDFESLSSVKDSGPVVASIFERSLMQTGYQLVDRQQSKKLLEEQHFQLSGAVDAAQAAKIGKILGVDALVLGEVTVYTPHETSVLMVDVNSESREPVIRKRQVEVMRDGKKVTELKEEIVDYRVTHETRQQPQVYYVQAQAGAVIKMVDAQTGEIAWVGSATEEGANVHAASESVAERITSSLRKQTHQTHKHK